MMSASVSPFNGNSAHSTSLDLAVIGNSVIGCIVDKTSKIVWSCFPKMDGDPIFNCLMNNNSEFSVSYHHATTTIGIF